MSRPGLQSMLARLEDDPEIRVVLTWKRNRLARAKDPVEGMELERRIIQDGRRLFYAATGQEADTSFESSIVSLVDHHGAGDFLHQLSQGVYRGTLGAFKNGHWPGGRIPFGYDRLIVDQSEVPVRVRRIRSCEASEASRIEKMLVALEKRSSEIRLHLGETPPEVAKSIGVNAAAEEVTREKDDLTSRLDELGGGPPPLPSDDEITSYADLASSNLDQTIESGTADEKRALIRAYVEKIVSGPDQRTIRVSLHPPLFGSEVPEVGLEPTRCCHQWILNPPRLPIPPLRRGSGRRSLSAATRPRQHGHPLASTA